VTLRPTSSAAGCARFPIAARSWRDQAAKAQSAGPLEIQYKRSKIEEKERELPGVTGQLKSEPR
jgi:hypothetical protein